MLELLEKLLNDWLGLDGPEGLDYSVCYWDGWDGGGGGEGFGGGGGLFITWIVSSSLLTIMKRVIMNVKYLTMLG